MISKGECMRRHTKTINQSSIFVHGGGRGGRGGAGNPSHTGIHKQLHILYMQEEEVPGGNTKAGYQ